MTQQNCYNYSIFTIVTDSVSSFDVWVLRRASTGINEKKPCFGPLLISLKWIFLAVVFTQVVRCSYFSIMPGSVLFDHVLSTHSVESSLICGQQCLRNKRCLSFNFKAIPSRNATFLCELSASDTKRSPMNLHKHSDYEYFEYKVSWICKAELEDSFQ